MGAVLSLIPECYYTGCSWYGLIFGAKIYIFRQHADNVEALIHIFDWLNVFLNSKFMELLVFIFVVFAFSISLSFIVVVSWISISIFLQESKMI